MTQDEYKQKVDKLVKQISDSKESLWRMVGREEYEAAATFKKRIDQDQQLLIELLSEKDAHVDGASSTK